MISLLRVWRYQTIIRIRELNKDRQHNGQIKKDKQQSTKHYTENNVWVTWTPLKTGLIFRSSVQGMLEMLAVIRKGM